MLLGCLGKGSDSSSVSTQSTVRLVNATNDYGPLNLSSSGTALATGIAYGSASAYSTLNSGSTSFTLESNGSGNTLAQTTIALDQSVDYTLVALTVAQQVQVRSYADNEAVPASGYGKLRVANLSADAGSVDVYVSEISTSLSAAAALTTYVNGTTSYFSIAKGTYQIRITGAGDKTDLRLDIPSITISDQQVLTLILTSAIGGGLVDGFLVTQKGNVSAQKNSSARVRLVANITSNGSIDATVNEVSLASNQRSPVVGSYTLVPAGPLAMTVRVNGNPVNANGLIAEAGADLTLLVLGEAAAPQFLLLNDHNKKLSASGMATLSLVNGINGFSDNIALTADYSLVANNVAPGTASAAANVSDSISRLEVNSSQANNSLYLATNLSLQPSGVYSLFMLGNAASPVGILRRNR